jgi:hypothetical protein
VVTTTGVGDITPVVAITFDCLYTAAPFITTGVEVVSLPDRTRYRLPAVTAGVLRWITDPPLKDVSTKSVTAAMDSLSLEEKAKKHITPVYKGAFIYFTVIVDPIKRPRTDGRNKASIQASLATATGVARDNLTQQLLEANQALDLLSNLPMTTLKHHLSFRGPAIKKLHDSITALADDPSLAPRQTPLGKDSYVVGGDFNG